MNGLAWVTTLALLVCVGLLLYLFVFRRDGD
jgi:hypothetical protein